MQTQAVLDGRCLEGLAQATVRRHAAGQHDALDAVVERGLDGFPHQHLHHRRLERSRDVGDLGGRERRALLHVERHRRLDAAEGEVGAAIAHLRERECDRLGIAGDGGALDHGPAGKAETEELGDLVESLPRGVVARLAHQRVRERRPRVIERGVAARDHERQERMLRRIVGQERGVDVSLQVIHGHQRQPVDVRKGLRDGAPHQQGADEPRALRDGDSVEIGQAHVGVRERLLHDRHDDLEVTARGELGDDAAVGGVDGILRGDDAREDTTAVGEHRRRRFVTRAFDPEYDHPSSLYQSRRLYR